MHEERGGVMKGYLCAREKVGEGHERKGKGRVLKLCLLRWGCGMMLKGYLCA